MTWAKLIKRARWELRLKAVRLLKQGHPLQAHEAWRTSLSLGRQTRILPPLVIWPDGPRPGGRYHTGITTIITAFVTSAVAGYTALR